MAALREALESAAARTVRIAELARESGRAGDPLTLSVANRLFGQSGYAFRRPFLELTRERYAAPFEAVDFESHPDRERRLINRWVEERTRDRIRELIPPSGIDEDTRLVLVNAIHMQAPWQEPFSKSATGPAPFHLALRAGIPLFFGSRGGRWGVQSVKSQVGTAEELPLDLFARLDVQGSGQGDGEVDIEARGLAFGTDDLNAHGIFCLHKRMLLNRLATCPRENPRARALAHELARLLDAVGALLHGGALGQSVS